MRKTPLLTALIAGLATAAGLSAAEARSARQEIAPAEKREFPFDAQIPGCQDAGVLEKITYQFAEKEAKFWNSSLTIVSYERIERTAWRPWPRPRRPASTWRWWTWTCRAWTACSWRASCARRASPCRWWR